MRSLIGMILATLCLAGLLAPVSAGATTGAPPTVAEATTDAATTDGAAAERAPATAVVEAPDSAALMVTAVPVEGEPLAPAASEEDLITATIKYLLRGEVQLAFATLLMLGLQQVRKYWDFVPDEWKGPGAAASVGAGMTAAALYAGLPIQEAAVKGVRTGLMALGAFSVLKPALERIPKVGKFLGFTKKEKPILLVDAATEDTPAA